MTPAPHPVRLPVIQIRHHAVAATVVVAAVAATVAAAVVATEVAVVAATVVAAVAVAVAVAVVVAKVAVVVMILLRLVQGQGSTIPVLRMTVPHPDASKEVSTLPQ